MPHRFALAAALLVVAAVTAHGWARPSETQPPGRAREFQGYWMGIDPLDGGDSRRSLVRLADGQYAMAGRDTVLTLCDGTDRGFISFDDGVVVGRDLMRTDSLRIACTNTGASVVLRVQYQLLADGLMVEDTTTLTGDPVSRIVFHKVSQD